MTWNSNLDVQLTSFPLYLLKSVKKEGMAVKRKNVQQCVFVVKKIVTDDCQQQCSKYQPDSEGNKNPRLHSFA